MRTARLLLVMAMILLPMNVLLSQQPDVPAAVMSARQALQNAYVDLQHAGGEWGGHRVAAMNHIQAAVRELSEAEAWARQHNAIR